MLSCAAQNNVYMYSLHGSISRKKHLRIFSLLKKLKEKKKSDFDNFLFMKNSVGADTRGNCRQPKKALYL